MKVCFPVQRNEGVESRVFNHFGTAPLFIVVDTETSEVSVIANRDQRHAHGQCNPVRVLGGEQVDAVVVGGIGGGALRGLNLSGIRVYQTQAQNVKENIALFRNQSLPEFTPMQCCGGHTQGGGCAH
ncbi:MAG: diguanylate cyclase [Nitrospirae bacterium]|nr:diguanylate cyclase [Nitrospirota bacterium]